MAKSYIQNPADEKMVMIAEGTPYVYAVEDVEGIHYTIGINPGAAVRLEKEEAKKILKELKRELRWSPWNPVWFLVEMCLVVLDAILPGKKTGPRHRRPPLKMEALE